MSDKTSSNGNNRTISVEVLARVEGEGGMHVRVKDGKVADVRLNIFEPPRFFEALMQGRDYLEAPDITARICGICPVAYQMSACHAMEQACGLQITGPLRELRRLLYCGEWIESHALHVFMLHAPDFLGYESSIHMSQDHPDLLHKALQIKKAGNQIVHLLGGRSVHPINVRVGGFYRIPPRAEFTALTGPLTEARDACLEVLPMLAGFDYPDFDQDYEFVALRHENEYPFNEGKLISSKGLDIPIEAYNDYFEEQHVAHSNALQARLKNGGNYFVGPLARFSLNFDKLSPLAQDAARQVGLSDACSNPFKSILVRTVELIYAFDEALRILNNLELPDEPFVQPVPRDGVGHGCTEAPRGILYHRYQIDTSGKIVTAQIVPPTSQNQATIESDLRHFVQKHLSLSHEALTWQCEQAIRNYDPCISCATHFLKLELTDDSVDTDG